MQTVSKLNKKKVHVLFGPGGGIRTEFGEVIPGRHTLWRAKTMAYAILFPHDFDFVVFSGGVIHPFQTIPESKMMREEFEKWTVQANFSNIVVPEIVEESDSKISCDNVILSMKKLREEHGIHPRKIRRITVATYRQHYWRIVAILLLVFHIPPWKVKLLPSGKPHKQLKKGEWCTLLRTIRDPRGQGKNAQAARKRRTFH